MIKICQFLNFNFIILFFFDFFDADTKKLKDLTELDATEDIGIRISIPSQFSKDAIRNRGIKPDVSSSVTVKMSHKKKKKEVPVCGVCKQGKGLLSQCSCPDCDKFFHPLCAWYEGMLLRVKGHEHEFMFSHDSTRTFQLFCREHLPASVGIRDMLQQRDIRNRYRHVKKKHHGFVQTKQQIDLEKSKERQQHRIANDGSIQDIDEVINNSALDPDSYATEKCAVCFMNFEALPEDEANNMDNRRNKEPNNNNNNQQQQQQSTMKPLPLPIPPPAPLRNSPAMQPLARNKTSAPPPPPLGSTSAKRPESTPSTDSPAPPMKKTNVVPPQAPSQPAAAALAQKLKPIRDILSNPAAFVQKLESFGAAPAKRTHMANTISNLVKKPQVQEFFKTMSKEMEIVKNICAVVKEKGAEGISEAKEFLKQL
eukprot:TRINITY_DN143_c1_g1_i2.p1 TRINITY_DN143_c1_g1~~TRINITY_DN143_c1_g1_i2.p1  ORF type:complete len:425 (+),score=133.65 TRINITY_DN143_c1_g1_i2:274-1548(+)